MSFLKKKPKIERLFGVILTTYQEKPQFILRIRSQKNWIKKKKKEQEAEINKRTKIVNIQSTSGFPLTKILKRTIIWSLTVQSMHETLNIWCLKNSRKIRRANSLTLYSVDN